MIRKQRARRTDHIGHKTHGVGHFERLVDAQHVGGGRSDGPLDDRPVDDRKATVGCEQSPQLVEGRPLVVDLVPEIDGDDRIGRAVGQRHPVVRGVDEVDPRVGGRRAAARRAPPSACAAVRRGAACVRAAPPMLCPGAQTLAQLREKLSAHVDGDHVAARQRGRQRQGEVADTGTVVDDGLVAGQREQVEHSPTG